MNDKKVTIFNELWMTKGHNIVNDIINNIMNDIVNNKKDHNIVRTALLRSQTDYLFNDGIE